MMPAEWQVKSLEQVAEFFGIDYQTVRRKWRSNGMPGSSGKYPLDAIVQWRFNQLAAEQTNDDAPPGMERFRDARATKAEIELQKLRGELVEAGRMHEGIVRLGSMLRSAGERLQKSYGPEAQAVLDETLDDYVRYAAELCEGVE